MNTSQQSSPHNQQHFQQLIQTRVQLSKCQSQLQVYKQLQDSYKKTIMKSQVMQKQLIHYQNIMQTFFEKIKKLMILLDIDDNIIMRYNQAGGYKEGVQKHDMSNSMQSVNDDISVITLNPTLARRINKLNSLKSITQISSHVEFKHQQQRISLIQNKLRQLLKNNSLLSQTLYQTQQSTLHIQLNTKEQQLITRRLQQQLRIKQVQVEQRDGEIGNLLKRISEMKDEIDQHQRVIELKGKQVEDIARMYEEMSVGNGGMGSLKQLQNHKNQVREQCRQLVEQLKRNDGRSENNYLLNYLTQDSVVIKCQRNVGHVGYSVKGDSSSKQWYSDSGNRREQLKTGRKYEFVFQ